MKGLPTAIAEALRDVDPSALPGLLVDGGSECEGAAYHSPAPLVLFKVATPKRTVLLCGTCRGNYFVLRTLLEHHRALDWPVLRSFGNRLRALLIPRKSDDA